MTLLQTILQKIDSGPYHAARTFPGSLGFLAIAVDYNLVRKGRFGYTLTYKGFRQAFPDFTSGDGSC